MLALLCVTGAVPSPKSKVYDTIVSAGAAVSGSEESVPLKLTVRGGLPDVGVAVSAALGALFGRHAALPTKVYDPSAVESIAEVFVSVSLPLPAKFRPLRRVRLSPATGLPILFVAIAI